MWTDCSATNRTRGTATRFFFVTQNFTPPPAACSTHCVIGVISHGKVTCRRRNLLDEERKKKKKKKNRDVSSRKHYRIISCLGWNISFSVQMSEHSCDVRVCVCVCARVRACVRACACALRDWQLSWNWHIKHTPQVTVPVSRTLHDYITRDRKICTWDVSS
jgi:hypothetical protein